MRRFLPIHQSLHRHAHVLGAERELVMTSALIALLVGLGGLTAVSIVSAVVFWIASVFALRRMAKADPIMSRVWLRHVKQQELYPAKAGRWREASNAEAERLSHQNQRAAGSAALCRAHCARHHPQ